MTSTKPPAVLPTHHPRNPNLNRALRNLLPNTRQSPRLTIHHPRPYQPLQRPQNTLRRRVRHPLELHQIIHPERLQLNYRRRQVGADYFWGGGSRESGEYGGGVEAVADSWGGASCAPGALLG